MTTTSTSDRDSVNYLFKASKCGFGPYEIAQPDEKTLVGRAARYGRNRLDPKQRGLTEESFVTQLDYLPPQLVGVVSEGEYTHAMEALKRVLATHKGPTVPFIVFFVYIIVGFVVDTICGWFGFFSVVVPVVSFYIFHSIIKKNYKEEVEGVLRIISAQTSTKDVELAISVDEVPTK